MRRNIFRYLLTMEKRDPFPSEEKYRYGVRMDDGLKARIETEAARLGISLNDVIVTCLLEKFPPPEPAAPDLLQIMEDLQAATSPDDFAARARAANAALEAAGESWRVDMVPPFPGKISLSRSPQVPVPPEGETVILGGRTVKKGKTE